MSGFRFVSESDSVFDDNLSPSNERVAGEEQEEEQEEEILYDRLPTTRRMVENIIFPGFFVLVFLFLPAYFLS